MRGVARVSRMSRDGRRRVDGQRYLDICLDVEEKTVDGFNYGRQHENTGGGGGGGVGVQQHQVSDPKSVRSRDQIPPRVGKVTALNN